MVILIGLAGDAMGKWGNWDEYSDMRAGGPAWIFASTYTDG
jgi:hypothetical protein